MVDIIISSSSRRTSSPGGCLNNVVPLFHSNARTVWYSSMTQCTSCVAVNVYAMLIENRRSVQTLHLALGAWCRTQGFSHLPIYVGSRRSTQRSDLRYLPVTLHHIMAQPNREMHC